jgi:hypothetical protein
MAVRRDSAYRFTRRDPRLCQAGAVMLRFGGGRQLKIDVGAPEALFRGAGLHRLRFPVTLDTRGTLPNGMPLHLSGQAWLSPAAVLARIAPCSG